MLGLRLSEFLRLPPLFSFLSSRNFDTIGFRAIFHLTPLSLSLFLQSDGCENYNAMQDEEVCFFANGRLGMV